MFRKVSKLKSSFSFRKVLIIFVVITVTVFIVISFLRHNKTVNIDENDLPKVIQADWIDLDRVGYISKFRSGAGHDFSGNGETCRSMKHYFNVLRSEEDQKVIDENNGFPPPFSLEGAVPIYSPVSGKVVDIKEDGSMGSQVYIQSERYPDFTVRLFHIFLLDGYKKGVKVRAGEQIGNIGRIQNTDIAVSVGNPHSDTFISYFQIMPDDVFAKYQAAGVKSRDQLIITKEYRDTHPLECDRERFTENYDAKKETFVFINGSKPLY